MSSSFVSILSSSSSRHTLLCVDIRALQASHFLFRRKLPEFIDSSPARRQQMTQFEWYNGRADVKAIFDLLFSLKAEIRSQISPRNAFTINHGVESSEKGRNLKSRMQIILFWTKLNQLAILINFTQNWLTNPVLCWQFILFTYIPPSPFHRLQQKIINKQTPGNKN